MSDTWMSIAEAAASLKVHPRTIERRIAGGKIQTRRGEDGIIQVLINLPDMSDNAPDNRNALETVRELAADQVTLATGSASALVKFAHDDAIRAREELSDVRHDARRARMGALVAWCVVALVGIGVTVAVGWTAQKITRANEDVRHLSDYAEKMQIETQKLIAERDNARQEAEQAKISGAEASGKLAAYVEQANNRPTTRPAGFLRSLVSAMSQE